MTWIVRTPDAPVHHCEPPMREIPDDGPLPPIARERPDGHIGDLWRCDACGMLWRIDKPEPQRYMNVFPSGLPRWSEAGWWTRFRRNRK